jgi:hypothetical protein
VIFLQLGQGINVLDTDPRSGDRGAQATAPILPVFNCAWTNVVYIAILPRGPIRLPLVPGTATAVAVN